MSIKNEFDIYQEAFEKINWKESVAPVIRGVMLVEDSQVEAYNKIQKLLNSTGMESCHSFLFDLDPSELTEAEATKVNNLYKLAQERGFVESDVDEEDLVLPVEPDSIATKTAEPPVPTPAPVPTPPPAPVKPTEPATAYTVLYSAFRNGTVKTGEAFSNALDTRSAKADIISKLERAGYQNISILAIEAGDPDSAGCDNTYCKQPEIGLDEIPDYSFDEDDIPEADDANPLGHALDPFHVKASTANAKGERTMGMSVVEPDKEQQDIVDDEVEENDMLHNRKHNLHIDEEDEEADDADADDSEDAEESDDKADDTKDDDTEDSDEETKEEDTEEPDEKLKDDGEDDDDSEEDESNKDEDELTATEKEQLKDSYKKAFKAALQKCKFKKAFFDLSLEEKIEFFTELEKVWRKKPDPCKFMTDKETEQLEKIVVKK